MNIIIETPEEAYAVRTALRLYEYKHYGWKYIALRNGKIEGIRCHRYLNNSSLQEALKDVIECLEKYPQLGSI